MVAAEVGTENFDLAAEGNHWHVYVDGVSYGMITGRDVDHALLINLLLVKRHIFVKIPGRVATSDPAKSFSMEVRLNEKECESWT
jgi:hypothetical protein